MPAYNEVLIKMSYAPVNPSDIYHAMSDQYKPAPYPHLNGLEGSGRVVGSGGGVLSGAYASLGLRVAVASGGAGFTWSQYGVGSISRMFPLVSGVSALQGSAAFVNPLTVVSFLETANEDGHSALVHTAASSALGLQLLRAAPKYNVTVVCVVRGEKNALALTGAAGHPAALVVRSDLPGFPAALRKAVQATGASLAFDAVGGELTRTVYDAMPAKSQTWVYGMLSGEEPDAKLAEHKGDAHQYAGFFMVTDWIEGGALRLPKALYALSTMLPNELSTEFEKVLDLTDPSTLDALRAYFKHQKGGKMAIKLN